MWEVEENTLKILNNVDYNFQNHLHFLKHHVNNLAPSTFRVEALYKCIFSIIAKKLVALSTNTRVFTIVSQQYHSTVIVL